MWYVGVVFGKYIGHTEPQYFGATKFFVISYLQTIFRTQFKSKIVTYLRT